MPRKLQKGLDKDVAPITPGEVERMFRSATSQGPYPDPKDYAVMAEMLNGSILSYTSDIRFSRECRRALEAAKRFQNFLDKLGYRHPVHTSVANLMIVLPEALRHLAPLAKIPKQGGVKNQPWSVAAAVAAETCKKALEGLDRPKGITVNSVIVVFAAKATQRMGFQNVTANSVHKLLTTLQENPGETHPRCF